MTGDRTRERWLAEIEARVDILRRETEALDLLIQQERDREVEAAAKRRQKPQMGQA